MLTSNIHTLCAYIHAVCRHRYVQVTHWGAESMTQCTLHAKIKHSDTEVTWYKRQHAT